jgi:hypothetical protein
MLANQSRLISHTPQHIPATAEISAWLGLDQLDRNDIFTHQPEGPSIGIAIAHELISWCSLKPFNSDAKLVVVYEAHKLTTEAQNALLKLIEEPAGYLYIVLCSSAPQQLLPTIQSRCQLFNWEGSSGHTTTTIDIRPELQAAANDFLQGNYLAKLKLVNQLLDKFSREEWVIILQLANQRLVEDARSNKQVALHHLTQLQQAQIALQNSANLKPTLEMLALVLS